MEYDKCCIFIFWLGRGRGGGGGGLASETLIYSISSSLLFCLVFIQVRNYPKLNYSFIFVILGNSEKVPARKINMRVCMGIQAN